MEMHRRKSRDGEKRGKLHPDIRCFCVSSWIHPGLKPARSYPTYTLGMFSSQSIGFMVLSPVVLYWVLDRSKEVLVLASLLWEKAAMQHDKNVDRVGPPLPRPHSCLLAVLQEEGSRTPGPLNKGGANVRAAFPGYTS